MVRVLGTVVLLFASNAFMTFAWYWHTQRKAWPIALAIGISWLIALPEYILQVPANRLGHRDFGGTFTLPQLKIMQEAITLIVFTLFVLLMTKERVRTTDYIAMGLVLLAVVVSVLGRSGDAPAGGDGAPVVQAQAAQ